MIAPEYLTNPRVFKIKRLDARSIFSTKGKYTKDIDLSGKWNFLYFPSVEEIPEGFENFSSSDFKSLIEVPSSIEIEGYGHPHYVNTQYPWDGKEELSFPSIPSKNPVGLYYKEVELKKSGRTTIAFYGVQTAFDLFINGKFAGYAEDSFTRSEFDITEYIKDGINRIIVRVFRFSSASWLEDQDFWRLSGIFRPVVITEKSHPYYLIDIDSKSNLSEDLKKGSLSIKVETNAKYVKASFNGNEKIEKVEDNIACFSFSIDNPPLWSAEKPNLLPYSISALDDNQEIVESTTLKTGFRRFEIKDAVMYLNGKRIIFHGVNRHEWNEKSGRTLSYEDTLLDIKTMKRNNINALRTSHYPNQPFLYDLCDQYGLYLIAESNLETHGTWQRMGVVTIDERTLPNDNEDYRAAVLDREESNYESFKNHPSILIWSLGNESAGGTVLRDAASYFRSKNDGRLVHYEGVFNDRRYSDTTSDIESQMYTPAIDVKAFLEKDKRKPFIMCEYSHAMGNSNGGLMDYVRLCRENEHFQLGFIWDYIDQNFSIDGKAYYGGDFSDRPSDFSFCSNGIVFSDRTESPKMAEVKYAYQDFYAYFKDNKIIIHNDSIATDLSEFETKLSYYEEGKLLNEITLGLSLGPKEKIEIENPFILSDKNNSAIRFTVSLKEDNAYAIKGYEIAHSEIFNIAKSKYSEESIKPIIGDVNYSLNNGTFSAMVDRTSGHLISLKKEGKEILLSSSRISTWRAPTDNDKGSNMMYSLAPFAIAGKYAKKEAVKLEDNSIISLFSLAGLDAKVEIKYEMLKNGKLKVDMIYLGPDTEAPEFGLELTLKKENDLVTYLGLGRGENMCDRKEGSLFGLYSFKASENLSRYIVPQESGTRCDVKKARVGSLEIEAEGKMVLSVSSYNPFEIENATHSYMLPPKEKTVLRILFGMRGVGGDNSWGAKPHDDAIFKLKDKDKFTFYLS